MYWYPRPLSKLLPEDRIIGNAFVVDAREHLIDGLRSLPSIRWRLIRNARRLTATLDTLLLMFVIVGHDFQKQFLPGFKGLGNSLSIAFVTQCVIRIGVIDDQLPGEAGNRLFIGIGQTMRKRGFELTVKLGIESALRFLIDPLFPLHLQRLHGLFNAAADQCLNIRRRGRLSRVLSFFDSGAKHGHVAGGIGREGFGNLAPIKAEILTESRRFGLLPAIGLVGLWKSLTLPQLIPTVEVLLRHPVFVP